MNGQSDTNTLVAATVPVSGGHYQAATMCRAHGPDWYLPAQGELVAMLGENGTGSLSFNSTGSDPAGYYWSASEYNNGHAWFGYYSGGWLSYPIGKVNSLSVRCVRR